MSYVQIQSTLTVLIDACLLLVPMLFVAHVVCKFGSKKAEDQGSIAEVETTEVNPEPEVETAEDQGSIAEVETAEDQGSIAEVETTEDQGSIAEVETAEVNPEPEVETAEDQGSIAEVETAEVNPEPESLFLALEKEQAMSQETLMDMLDRVSEEVESSIHAWYEGSELLTEPMEVGEARLRFKAGEDLVVSAGLLGNREFFKVQKIGTKYVYGLNFEGVVCKLCITGVKFWQA